MNETEISNVEDLDLDAVTKYMDELRSKEVN